MLHLKNTALTCLWDAKLSLGEGVVWIAEEESVYFVDIIGNKICRYHLETQQHTIWDTVRQPVFILPTSRNVLLCGMDDGLYWFSPVDGSLSQWFQLNDSYSNNRFNDGYIDSSGQLWLGTMDRHEQDATGSLYCLEWRENKAILIQKDTGYVVTNGPFISDQHQKLFHNHSNAQIIYEFDLNSTDLSNKRIFTEIQDGYPDGMALDSHDDLWVCLYNGHGIHKYNQCAKLIDQIEFPCPNVTKITFGGKEGKTAFVTTARKGMSEKELQLYPQAGGLFSFDVDVAGQKQHHFYIPDRYILSLK